MRRVSLGASWVEPCTHAMHPRLVAIPTIIEPVSDATVLIGPMLRSLPLVAMASVIARPSLLPK